MLKLLNNNSSQGALVTIQQNASNTSKLIQGALHTDGECQKRIKDFQEKRQETGPVKKRDSGLIEQTRQTEKTKSERQKEEIISTKFPESGDTIYTERRTPSIPSGASIPCYYFKCVVLVNKNINNYTLLSCNRYQFVTLL